MTTSTIVETRVVGPRSTRWTQLICGVICMVMVANLQLGGPHSSTPLTRNIIGAATPSMGVHDFVVSQTWLVPLTEYRRPARPR